MKNNPESGEFCCLHICLFNNGKAYSFLDDLDAPASSFSLVSTIDGSPLFTWMDGLDR